MSNFTIEHVRESVMSLVGKNLFFDKDINVLFWTDVLGGQIFKLDLNNNMINVCRILGEKTISFVVPIKGKRDQFIVGAGKRLLQITWDGVHTIGQIQKVLGELQNNGARFNQFKVDKQGRLFFGTMINEEQGDVVDHNKRIGALYRFTMQEGIVLLKDSVGMGNGIVWNNQFNKMYFVDSFDTNIIEFDYDLKTGNIHNQNIFVDFKGQVDGKKTFFTGMTIDQQDNIFVTVFGDGKIVKFNTKTKKMEQEIKFNNLNVKQLTGVEFGGKNLDTLYVTSAAYGLHGQQQQYPSGFLMKVGNMGTKGTDMYKFDMN